MRASEWIRAAVDDGFARRRKPKQQDGGELTGNELSILRIGNCARTESDSRRPHPLAATLTGEQEGRPIPP